ncbi:unnamed protein product [Chilo suppressalis]|uniref:Secreted protein n=1 Tax=Chilo suppressalis TaxID=168631 RepID=A0ABN8B1C5_CHISP|nr:unnamed protein product [Chilo suppressalis]
MRRDVASLCVFFGLYTMECFKVLFNLAPAATFLHRTPRRREKFYPQHLDAWRSSTMHCTMIWRSLKGG